MIKSQANNHGMDEVLLTIHRRTKDFGSDPQLLWVPVDGERNNLLSASLFCRCSGLRGLNASNWVRVTAWYGVG